MKIRPALSSIRLLSSVRGSRLRLDDSGSIMDANWVGSYWCSELLVEVHSNRPFLDLPARLKWQPDQLKSGWSTGWYLEAPHFGKYSVISSTIAAHAVHRLPIATVPAHPKVSTVLYSNSQYRFEEHGASSCGWRYDTMLMWVAYHHRTDTSNEGHWGTASLQFPLGSHQGTRTLLSRV